MYINNIVIEFRIGTDLKDALRHAKGLALQNDTCVMFEFNDHKFVITECSNLERQHKNYYKED